MFQKRFELVLKYLMELLGLILLLNFTQLFYALDEELQLLENLFEHLNILVVHWLMKQIV